MTISRCLGRIDFEPMNGLSFPALLRGFTLIGCGKRSGVYEGSELFAVPALEDAGSGNSKLEEVLPPGIQELDLGLATAGFGLSFFA